MDGWITKREYPYLKKNVNTESFQCIHCFNVIQNKAALMLSPKPLTACFTYTDRSGLETNAVSFSGVKKNKDLPGI